MTSSIPILFIRWYLVDAPRAILHSWRNFLIWAANHFSLGMHLTHLFSPWRRTVTPYTSQGFDFSAWVESVLITNFSRLIGFVIRIVTVIIGLVWLLLVFLFGFLLFIGWYALPLVIILNFLI